MPAPPDLSQAADSTQAAAVVTTHTSKQGSRAIIRHFWRELFTGKGNANKPTTSDSASETDGGTPEVLTNGACLSFIEMHSACLGADGATRAMTAMQDAVQEFRALQEARCWSERHDIQQYLSEPYTGSIGGPYDVGRSGKEPLNVFSTLVEGRVTEEIRAEIKEMRDAWGKNCEEAHTLKMANSTFCYPTSDI